LRCQQGTVSEPAQKGLRSALIDKNYLLACQCVPESEMSFLPADPHDLFSRATVIGKEMLSQDVCRVLLETATPLYYHPGQYINLRRWDGLIRSYSLASVPRHQPYLELHIKILPQGQMSSWIQGQMQVGLNLEFQGPQGHCYYREEYRDSPLLLIATGTGLAPIWAILQDALDSGHAAPIWLYHGSHTVDGLYLDPKLRDLVNQCSFFHYVPCVSGPDTPAHCSAGRAHDLALRAHTDLSHWVVFACGHPEMVHSLRVGALQAGTALERLFSDAFETPGAHLGSKSESMQYLEESHVFPEPDFEMWHALGEGVLLAEILSDFYDLVYADPELAPYFKVTKEHVAGKQYAFLYQAFTGEDVYFGELPRNAHHWMVISDELFDHRERLMENTLHKHQFPPHLIQRWLALEESYRAQIVKKEAWPKIAFGQEFPLDGYESIEMEFGALCDGCGNAIDCGTQAHYHKYLGTVYCQNCSSFSEQKTKLSPV
jgi:NAD(P)H-flavin reductase/truncated hemoglobin YjbI